MSTQTTERPGRLARLASLLDDPILLKELRAAFRRKRFFWLQTGLLALVALIVLVTMWVLTDDYRRDPSEIGRRTFLIFATLELGLIFFIFPAFACTSITDERTNKSIDLLLTTNLSPSRIVLGKTLASFVYGLQFIVATLPLVALTFLYGGVTPGQIVLTYGVMVVLAALITIHALSVSSAAPSTLRAVLSTYIGLVLIVVPLAAPLITTTPFALFDLGRSSESGNGVLSGILAVHVFGPLQKDQALLHVRDEVRGFDALTSVLYWGGHAAFYASAISLFFLIARHRLAPNATNRSTPIKVWFVATLGTFLAGTLVALVHLQPYRYGNEVLITLELALFFVLTGAAVAFAGEDPAIPRRLRAAFEATKGLRAPLRMLYPGGANGMRFLLWVALLAHLAVFVVFAGLLDLRAIPVEGGLRPPLTVLLWGSAWSLLFAVFVAELAFILSCELRHEVASRACAAIAVIAIALGPFLWYVLEYPEKKPYAFKGYWTSPVTIGLSVFTVPTRGDAERQLQMFGPSGGEIRLCREAVERRLLEFLAPPGDRVGGDPVKRTREELEKEGLDEESIRIAADEVALVVPRVPKDPGAITDELGGLREESRLRLMRELGARGVPVHQVSVFAYLGIVLVLGGVIRKRYMKLAV